MTSILSSISGYFSRALILGTFLPVTIFVVLSTIFLLPILPSDLTVSSPLSGLEKEWKVVGLSFLTIVISGLLYNMNIPILRLYEGYPWRRSWIGSWLERRHIAKFEAAELRIEAMRAVLRRMEAIEKDLGANVQFAVQLMENWKSLGSPLGMSRKNLENRAWLDSWHATAAESRLDQLTEQWKGLSSALATEFSTFRIQVKHTYPDKPGLILPTRLGNVIRSFEYYSHREYGIDSVEIWPRLVSVIPKEYAVSVDDTKTTFDFMLNCSLLSFLLATAIFVVGLLYPSALLAESALLSWGLKIVAFILLSYFFYRLSINRADAWGLLIKAAFDLYRWDLLKKLGYQQPLDNKDAERKHWQEISRQAIYGDRFDKKLMRYANPTASFPSATPADAELEISRGVTRDQDSDAFTIHLRVKNLSAQKDANDIRITDRLAEGFEFEWNSAKIGSQPIRISGINPYQLYVGDLTAGQETTVTYCAFPRTSSRMSVNLT